MFLTSQELWAQGRVGSSRGVSNWSDASTVDYNGAIFFCFSFPRLFGWVLLKMFDSALFSKQRMLLLVLGQLPSTATSGCQTTAELRNLLKPTQPR